MDDDLTAAPFPGRLKTVDEADPQLLVVEGKEQLLRRFNQEDDSHFLSAHVDEVTGASGLQAAAFAFDADGCSVFRQAILDRAGIARAKLMSNPRYAGLAEGRAGEVRGLSYQTEGGEYVTPFKVFPTPYPSGPNPRRYGVAHASITLDRTGLIDYEVDLVVGLLARAAFRLTAY